MSATFADATTACSQVNVNNESRSHATPERTQLSIERRWCELCRSYHMYAFLQRPSRKAWTRKAKEVVILFVIGEMIAIGILVLAGGVLAATR